MIALLTVMIDLVDNKHWRNNLKKARSRLQAVDVKNRKKVRAAANVVLGMYGGMGGLNDNYFYEGEFEDCSARLYDITNAVAFDEGEEEGNDNEQSEETYHGVVKWYNPMKGLVLLHSMMKVPIFLSVMLEL